MLRNDMTHHISNYRKIFVYLLIGTVLTVTASYLEFNVQNSIAGAVFVGLTIATVKGYLVAANFMHLNSENYSLDFIVNCILSRLIIIYTLVMGFKSHESLLNQCL